MTALSYNIVAEMIRYRWFKVGALYLKSVKKSTYKSHSHLCVVSCAFSCTMCQSVGVAISQLANYRCERRPGVSSTLGLKLKRRTRDDVE